MRVRFLAPAELELFEAAAYYEIQVHGLGKDFLTVVEAAIADISKHPESWLEISEGLRKRPLRRFPYSVLYQIDRGEIIIIAVMHQKQRPRYWVNRL